METIKVKSEACTLAEYNAVVIKTMRNQIIRDVIRKRTRIIKDILI